MRFRSYGTTTRDRAMLAARDLEHVDTYGTPVPDRRAFLSDLAFVIMVILSVAYLAACVINYASGVSALADMCAAAWNAPATDAIPDACR